MIRYFLLLLALPLIGSEPPRRPLKPELRHSLPNLSAYPSSIELRKYAAKNSYQERLNNIFAWYKACK